MIPTKTEMEKLMGEVVELGHDLDTDGDWELMERVETVLRALMPEEREGRCVGGHMIFEYGGWWPTGHDLQRPSGWSNCPWCGDDLGGDGIARRHPAAALAERVRAELDTLSTQYGDDTRTDGKSIGVMAAVSAIRKALDGPGGGDGE